MSTTVKARPAALMLTPAAEARIAALMAKAPEGAIGVKLSTPRRGCSGLAYSVDYVSEAAAFDERIETPGGLFFVDGASVLYLVGSTMDWRKLYGLEPKTETDRCAKIVGAVHKISGLTPHIGVGRNLSAPKRPCIGKFEIPLASGGGEVQPHRRKSGGFGLVVITGWQREVEAAARHAQRLRNAHGKSVVSAEKASVCGIE